MTSYFYSIDRRLAAIALAVMVAVAFFIAWAIFGWRSHTNPPEIPFAPTEDSSIKDPDNPIKIFHIDFARVENEFPLSVSDLTKITPENILELPEEKIDQIYGRITAGPIPDGAYEGNVFVARDGNLKNRFEGLVGGIEGRISGAGVNLLEKVSRIVWKGKQFYSQDRLVRNFIEDSTFFRTLVDDPSTLKTATIPRHSIFRFFAPTNEVWLLFPAKLYCGQSLLDSRRESIILDYGYDDEIEGYRENPDILAGRNGLKIREEMRMIRPGFYLGRTYSNRMFVSYFTLFNAEIAQSEEKKFTAGTPSAEDCWPGEQIRKATTQ
jgi:hypothetical protein